MIRIITTFNARSKYLQLRVQGPVAQLVVRLTQEPGVPASIPSLATYFHFSFRRFKGQVSVTAESVCTKYWLTA